MTNMALEIPTKDGRRWDLVALGEVMLRFDPGDDAHPHDADVSRLGRRRRVQRRARIEAVLRPRHGAGDGAGRQPGRPSGAGPDLPGRRRSVARALGQVRRRRARGPQRAELHRAWLRHARRGRLFGSRPHRGLAARSGRRRLGGDLRARRRALVAHRRHLLRAVGDDAAGRPRSDGGGAAARRRSCPSISTTANRCGARFGGHERAHRGQSRAGPARRRADRQRRGFFRCARLSRSAACRTSSRNSISAQFKRDDPCRSFASFPNLKVVATTLRHAKTATVNDWSAHLLGERRVLRVDRRGRTSRSSTASAAATPLRPA